MQRAIDVSIIAIAFIVAFLLRFDFSPEWQMLKRMVFLVPYVVILKYTVLSIFAIPTFSWRHVGLREIYRIALASGVASIVLLAIRLVGPLLVSTGGYIQYLLVPISVVIVDFSICFLGLAGVRVVRRSQAERENAALHADPQVERKRTLLVGAGDAGLVVAKELSRRIDLGVDAVAFIDDAPHKRGTRVHGVLVVGDTLDIATWAERLNIEQVLVTIANASRSEIRNIVKRCELAGLPTKIIPGLSEIVGGNIELSRIRDVSIEDLLGRDPINLDSKSLASFIQGKVVLVTGAGGSIGSELCRQVLRFAPKALLLLERSEPHLFTIYRELRGELESVLPCVGDVLDQARVDDIFSRYQPDVVIHAAAHKHVPLMEMNPLEAIKNNVFGTKMMADAAVRHGASAFVLVSTDKAINPTSVMGTTKRIAELYVQCQAQKQTTTQCVAVRFGNVLGSTGSVVPIFKEQIASGGPVTVTHPEMTRYFMTIPEASQLVLQAAALGQSGEVFVLDMGEPIKILDLARDLIKLSGFDADKDMQIVFSGVRPGEKLFEEISTDAENAQRTKHPKIFTGTVLRADPKELGELLISLKKYVELGHVHRCSDMMRRIVPESTIQNHVKVLTLSESSVQAR